MGCDIHAYIDYDWIVKREGEECVRTRHFCAPTFGRDYSLFSLMAGGLRDERLADSAYPVRGLPERLSLDTEWAYTLRVSDEDWAQGAQGHCSSADAARWTTPRGKEGWTSSTWWNEEHTRVTHPDWHTASWLAPDEFEDCIAKYNERFTGSGPVHPCVDAILAAMRALEARGMAARLVFWFDN